jgi:site-specific DNA-methyltransferase (adenine-specific)
MILDYRNIDCNIGMKEFPDKYFELAIVDPNYGIGEDGLKNHSRDCLATSTKFIPKEWDKTQVDKITLDEIRRVSKNQIIFGANHFISKLPFDSSCWIVWDKDNGETDFADCELAWTSFKTAVRKFTYKWQGMLQGDMKNKELRIHPTQKPVKLYKWLFSKYAKLGDKILDTHVGSGSSIIACIQMGFDVTGFELDEDYYKASMERIENELHKKDETAFVEDLEMFKSCP